MAFEFKIDGEKSIKNIRKEFQKNGVFYSSLDLAEKLKKHLPIDITEVYDPTCGNGNLLAVFDDGIKKYGQELDPLQAEYAQSHLVNAEIVAGDTLKNPAFMGHKFKAIIANPPFSVKWEPFELDPRWSCLPAMPPKSKADYAFITHCLHYLSDDGKAVCLDAHGVLFRGNAEGKIRQWLIDNNYIEKVISYDGGYFADTPIPTVALVLSKSKVNTDIYFEDTKLKKSRYVSLEEIKSNDYNLNIPRYIQEEIQEVKYDFKQEALDFVNNLKDDLKSNLALCKMLDEIELTATKENLLNFEQYKQELKEIIESA